MTSFLAIPHVALPANIVKQALPDCSFLGSFATVNYSSSTDGVIFVVRKKPVKGMRVRPLMIKYRVSRFEYATTEVDIKGPMAGPRG